jgi:arylsulfatase A-like enzyme
MKTDSTRRDFIKTMGLGAAVLAAGGTAFAGGESGARPNILFIFTDDHARQAISAYGGRLAKVAPTPNIDRIAKEGMLFTRCCVTNSICAPSRAVILTGKHSHLNGVINNAVRFDGSQQTFPKLLQKEGYQTAIVGKWHLKSEPTGFDYWEVLPGQGHYYNPEFRTPGGTVNVIGYATDIITDKGLDWLENKRDKKKPFVLMIQHKAPHREWLPDPKHLNLFDDVTIPEPETLFDDYEGRGTAAKKQDMTIAKTMNLATDLKVTPDEPDKRFESMLARMTDEQRRLWDAAYGPKNEAFKKAQLEGKELVRWKYQRYMKDYLRCIASVDENIGRMLDYLDESGLAKNTVVIYSSDQGFYLGEHGWFDKRFMYEESFGTPLVARWPGVIAPGRVNDDLVSNLDFAQTFLDIAGVEQPSDMQGASLKAIMLGKTPDNWRKSLYYHYYEYPAVHSVRRHEGVATKRYKLLHFYDLGEWELYDLEKDPHEMKSEYDNPEYAGIVAELKAELERLRTYYKVPEE